MEGPGCLRSLLGGRIQDQGDEKPWSYPNE